jgi:hypothetical protein
MEMDESGLCPECGAHDYVSGQHVWLNNGDIVMKTGQTERLVLFESENLDPLMSGIEEIIGVSIEHIVQRGTTRLRVDAPSLVARMRRTPVTCAGKAQIVVKYRFWKGHMKNVGLQADGRNSGLTGCTLCGVSFV